MTLTGSGDTRDYPAPMDQHSTVSTVEHEALDLDQYATEGGVFFLFGIFCAYWAQQTNRNAWLWFFLGLFFAPITGVVLLWKNAQDRKPPPPR